VPSGPENGKNRWNCWQFRVQSHHMKTKCLLLDFWDGYSDHP
jgi:hypothetical protein